MHNHIPEWKWDSSGQYWIYTRWFYLDDQDDWMDYNAYIFRDGDSYLADADDNDPVRVGTLTDAMRIAEENLSRIFPSREE